MLRRLFWRLPATRVWRWPAAWLLMAVTYLPTCGFMGFRTLGAVFPVAAAFYSCATWLSAVRYWLGRGGQWKGARNRQMTRS